MHAAAYAPTYLLRPVADEALVDVLAYLDGLDASRSSPPVVSEVLETTSQRLTLLTS